MIKIGISLVFDGHLQSNFIRKAYCIRNSSSPQEAEFLILGIKINTEIFDLTLIDNTKLDLITLKRKCVKEEIISKDKNEVLFEAISNKFVAFRVDPNCDQGYVKISKKLNSPFIITEMQEVPFYLVY